MTKRIPISFAAFLFLFLILGLFLTRNSSDIYAAPALVITGTVLDTQNQPVAGAQVQLLAPHAAQPVVDATSQSNGRYTLVLPDTIPDRLTLHIDRPHFAEVNVELTSPQLAQLRAHQSLVLADTTLERHLDLAFWIACTIFVFVLVLIATRKLHRALAALLGAVLTFAISYLGRPLGADLFIFSFDDALHYVDWNVIFLIMGMMIIIAIIRGTGIFQWLAYHAYHLSRGRLWLLVIILMLVTSMTSALLDNVTTLLLLTPITIQIARVLDISPLSLLMPELMASNVAGISTLIGTPTNVLIGSYAHLSFSDFLINLTPGVLLALVGLGLYSLIAYRNDLKPLVGVVAESDDDFKQHAHIREPGQLKKAGIVGVGMLLLFVFGQQLQLVPAVTALIGAVALLIWLRPDVEQVIQSLDWTTLVFFIALFILVGSVEEVGLMSVLAEQIAHVVGSNLILTMLAIVLSSAILSAIVANIPLTAAMLPVIGYLSATVPGAESHVLFYCLAVGAALGGNGSLIGASANMVTAGLSEREGYPITYTYFLKKGVPATIITLVLATLWLWVRFILLP